MLTKQENIKLSPWQLYIIRDRCLLAPGDKKTIMDKISYHVQDDPEKVMDYLIKKGYINKNYHWSLEISQDRLLHIQHLEFKLHEAKKKYNTTA